MVQWSGLSPSASQCIRQLALIELPGACGCPPSSQQTELSQRLPVTPCSPTHPRRLGIISKFHVPPPPGVPPSFPRRLVTIPLFPSQNTTELGQPTLPAPRLCANPLSKQNPGWQYQDLPMDHGALLDLVLRARRERKETPRLPTPETEEDLCNQVTQVLSEYVALPDNAYANQSFLFPRGLQGDSPGIVLRSAVESTVALFQKHGLPLEAYDAHHLATYVGSVLAHAAM